MNSAIKVGLIGFSNIETIKIERILMMTRQKNRQYLPIEQDKLLEQDNLAVLMANSENETAMRTAERIADDETKLVLVGNYEGEIKAGWHFINKPIIGVRVISLLDELFGLENATETVKEVINAGKTEDAAVFAHSAAAVMTLPSINGGAGAFRVLVVDDSVLIHKAVANELKRLSVPVSIDFAANGEQALQLIAERAEYDLVFLDIVMPGIDGYETCKRIRQDARYSRQKPIIMLSSKSSAVEQLNGFAAGCTNFLIKPIVSSDFHNMLERVVSWLKTHNGQRAA